MADLIGFVAADSDTAKTAAGLFTLRNSASPFQNGRTFTVSGFEFKVSESIDYATKAKSLGTRPHPVLVTSIGDLFVSSLRDRYDTDGNTQETDGDLNKEFKRLLEVAKSDGEILQGLVKFCKKQTFVVRRSKPFETSGYNGRKKMMSLINIDIKK